MHTNTNHTYKRYDKELNKLRDQISRMGNHVSRQLNLLLNHLETGDPEQFEEIIENDVTINGMEVKASKTVIRLLAKRSPVGGDLRMIIASSRIVTELERVGDEIVAMAKTLMAGSELGICEDKSVAQTLETLIATAMNLLDRALLAAQNDDEVAAKALIDEHVQKGGRFHKEAEELVLCVKEHYDSTQQSFHAALLINALTRISDHVSNICEHIIFSITGEDIRHLDEED